MRSEYDWMIGKVFRTPWELSGLVEVTEIIPEKYLIYNATCVEVKFLEDHPMGYKKDSLGCYLADELKLVDSGG